MGEGESGYGGVPLGQARDLRDGCFMCPDGARMPATASKVEADRLVAGHPGTDGAQG